MKKIIAGIAIGFVITLAAYVTADHIKHEMGHKTPNETLAIECIGGPEEYGIIHINGNAIARNVEIVFKNETVMPLENLKLSCAISLLGNEEILIIIN